MSVALNLPCVRFVKRVTNGALLSKYSYLAMMAQNAENLEKAPWHLASNPLREVTMPVNMVSKTDASYNEDGTIAQPPSFTAFLSDAFDAYQQGGDARRETATMCGYAGCVAYRFKIPTSAANASLQSVSLLISRDRYCRAGVRVALQLSNSAVPSNDWKVVRGTATGTISSSHTTSDTPGVESWGFMAQDGVSTLLSSRAEEDTITFYATQNPALAATGCAYLWVYITLEDYKSYWTMYNAKEPRYYSIEGSAMLVASRAVFVYGSNSVVADSDDYVQAWYAANGAASREARSDTTTAAQLAAYGNLMVATRCAAINLSMYNGIAGVLTNIEKARSKPLLGFSPPGSIASLAGGYYQMDDVDTLGVLRNFGVRYNDYYFRNSEFSEYSLSCNVVHVQTIVGGEYPTTLKPDGTILTPTIAYWKCVPVIVPEQNRSFSRLSMYRYESPTSQLIAHTDGFDCDLLIWKSTSQSLFDTWSEAAIAALMSRPAFLSGKVASVSGTMTGDGSLTQGKNVTAEATLFQRIDLDGFTGTSLDVDLVGPVKPGEVLILVPTIKRMPYSLGGGVTLQFDFGVPYVRLA